MDFKEWFYEESLKDYFKSAAGLATAAVTPFIAGPDTGVTDEQLISLFKSVSPLLDVAQIQAKLSGYMTLTPEEAFNLSQQCFTKNMWSACQVLCKHNNKRACSKVGKTKIGRRWAETDPLLRYR